jgi:hypothetical protein
MNYEDLEGSGCALIEVLIGSLPGETEKTTKNFYQDFGAQAEIRSDHSGYNIYHLL